MIAIPENEITNYTLGGAYLALRRAVIEALDLLGLSTGNVDQYLNNRALRDDLIQTEYNRRREDREKSEAIICDLAGKYGLAMKSVENIVHRK